jgi:hypothetical protein
MRVVAARVGERARSVQRGLLERVALDASEACALGKRLTNTLLDIATSCHTEFAL